MQSRIGMWGGSCAIRLPKMAVESLGFHEGEEVRIEIDGDSLVIRPAAVRYALSDLVERAKALDAPDLLDDAPMGDEQV